MARAKTKAEAPAKQINPLVDNFLRFLLLVTLLRQLRFCMDTYETNPDQIKVFGLSFLITIVAIVVSKRLFGLLGTYISSRKEGDPLSNITVLKKFEDQGWQLVIHVTMAVWEIYLVSEGPAAAWWADPKTIGCPGTYTISKPIENFVLLQLAIWLVTGFSCTFFEERRKDYLEMMLHHILTNLLIGTAIINGEHAFAILILLVHDLSDVLVDFLKLSNYLKLEGPKCYFISEILFATLVFGVWPYFRLFLYPYIVIQGEFLGYQEKCSDWNDGVATFDITKVEVWISSRCFLCMALASLHVFWWFLFIRILYSIVVGGKVGSEAVGEKLEGDSSSGSSREEESSKKWN